MSATHNPTGTAVDAVDIDNGVELVTEQIKALKELAQEDDKEPITEGQRYDFSIRWGTVFAGRLRRLAHYSSLGTLDDVDERRFRALRDERRRLSHLIDRFRLAYPAFTDGVPSTAKRFRTRHGESPSRARRFSSAASLSCQLPGGVAPKRPRALARAPSSSATFATGQQGGHR
jgi:hypothetical protein